MDSDDTFYRDIMPEFFKTYYRIEDRVSAKFKDKILSSLRTIAKKYNAKSMGVIDLSTDRSDKYHVITNSTVREPNAGQTYIGLISLSLTEFRVPENGVFTSRNALNAGSTSGHWAGWIFRDGIAILYDSMATEAVGEGFSSYSASFKSALREVFGDLLVRIDTPTACGGCRAGSARQPTGGFVLNSQMGNIIEQYTTKNINKQTAINMVYGLRQTKNMNGWAKYDSDFDQEFGYRSQHQYCFAEALMFLEDFLSGKKRNDMCTKNYKNSLMTIKKYIFEKIGKPRALDSFMVVYNPNTNKRNKITY